MSVNPMPPKSAGKAPVKSIAPTESQSKKSSKRKRSTAAVGLQFRSAIKKVLKEVSPGGDIKITEKTLSVLCGISNALIEDVVVCAADLAKKVDKETIGVDDLSTAFELMTSGELRALCIKEMNFAIAKPKEQENK